MNDNYLWDRTGEPDAEVQQLEQLLGELRYQPSPFEVPAGLVIRRRSFLPLAIAAAVALLALALGLWTYSTRAVRSSGLEARQKQLPLPAKQKVPPAADRGSAALSPQPPDALPLVAAIPVSRRPARRIPVSYRSPKPPLSLTADELAQKEQVLLALRLVSAKLNLAQRKTQGTPLNMIRNQHKIG